ncbi:MAG TPA: hypothetical protein VFC00_22830 [Micromonosporaceae bacterium]|nr:hypothetical protein [Micromonosporaceae bacterium]
MTWLEIAASLRAQHSVSALVAARMAHGWNHDQAATEWNTRWPDHPVTGRNFAYWEAWATDAGYPPSLNTFIRLAKMYQVAVSDLMEDVGNYRHLDSIRTVVATVTGADTLR